MADQIAKPKNPEDDWKIWLVVNPSTWIIPIFIALVVLAIAIHKVVFGIGFGWA